MKPDDKWTKAAAQMKKSPNFSKMFVEAQAKRSKYGNRKVVKNGETFDSVREYERHLVLLDMQKRGEIAGLERQPIFILSVGGERICKYIGDWRYWVLSEGAHPSQRPCPPQTNRHARGYQVVEDCKGFQTPEFKLKFRLAKALYPQIDWRLS